MKTIKCLLVPALVLTLSLAACSARPAAVFTTLVDSDGRPLNSATAFTVDTPRIICSVGTAGLPVAGEITAKWLFGGSDGWKQIKEETLAVAGGPYLVFPADAPVTGWVPGEYAVQLYLDGREASSAGFTVRLSPDVQLPGIKNFSAVPDTITAGQPLTLSWNVENASSINIQPGIGAVTAGGSRLVSPAADTTYTLTALNSGGPSMKSVSVTVRPYPTTHASLAIVDLFREARMVYYTVSNTGDAVSQPSSSELYVGKNVAATGYIPPMAPGETRTLVFGAYSWSYSFDMAATVCIDAGGENGPSGTAEKCLTRVLPGARVF
ncbi:MAG: CARDB domain-containing protein [Dehalococcoidia bacterium]